MIPPHVRGSPEHNEARIPTQDARFGMATTGVPVEAGRARTCRGKNIPTMAPEEINPMEEILGYSFLETESNEHLYEEGCERRHGSARGEAPTPPKRPRDLTPHLRREEGYNLFLQSEILSAPSTSVFPGGTSLPALGTGNGSDPNQHLFSPAASPPLILAFLAVGLFTVSMIGVFGWRRVQYARGSGRADLAWLSAGGVRGLGGMGWAGMAARTAEEERRAREGKEECEKERPQLWDLWTKTGMEEDAKGKKREGKEAGDWDDIMPISVRIIAPPPKPSVSTERKKKKHGKSKKSRHDTTAVTEVTLDEVVPTLESTSPPQGRASIFVRIRRWARKRYSRRSNAAAATAPPSQPIAPTRTSSSSSNTRPSTDIPLSPLQRLARAENAQPWVDYRTIQLAEPSGSSRSSRRRSSADRTRANTSTNTPGTSREASSSSPNDPNAVLEGQDIDPELNDFEKQLEREGLERCPITGMIVEKRDGLVGDIRNGIRKRKARKAGSGKTGRGKERARIQVAVAIVMPKPPSPSLLPAVKEEEEAKVAMEGGDGKRRGRRRRKAKTEDDALNAHISTSTPRGVSIDAAAAVPLPPSPTPLPLPATGSQPDSRPPTRMTVTTDGGSMTSYVTAPDEASEDGQRTPVKAGTSHPQSSPSTNTAGSPAPAVPSPLVQSPEEEEDSSEYEDSDADSIHSTSHPTSQSKPILLNFGSPATEEQELKHREETARQVVYAFGLYECHWRLSSSKSRARAQGLQEKRSYSEVLKSGSGAGGAINSSEESSGSSGSTSGATTSGSGTGTSSSGVTSEAVSGLASPREELPSPMVISSRPGGGAATRATVGTRGRGDVGGTVGVGSLAWARR